MFTLSSKLLFISIQWEKNSCFPHFFCFFFFKVTSQINFSKNIKTFIVLHKGKICTV